MQYDDAITHYLGLNIIGKYAQHNISDMFASLHLYFNKIYLWVCGCINEFFGFCTSAPDESVLLEYATSVDNWFPCFEQRKWSRAKMPNNKNTLQSLLTV
jgi:hypothetical protein